MKKLAIVYWSGTGNTESMANGILEGANSITDDVDLIFSDDFSDSNVDDYEVIAFGCPSMGDEELEDSFEDMFSSCEDKLNGKKIALFGSYEWNNGEWMETWTNRAKELGANLVAISLPVYDNPTDEDLDKCKEFGKICASA
ncbi:flavodoxin [Miniphocaeibacter massiliensis]|uniref:flavodoxin n=1 Tax=Miniphocaeibacter massiliensis TaxID=2041841 RepID=UPI000C074BF5|nr:flavodoxin [Miniphocaeibacter massiliensis]